MCRGGVKNNSIYFCSFQLLCTKKRFDRNLLREKNNAKSTNTLHDAFTFSLWRCPNTIRMKLLKRTPRTATGVPQPPTRTKRHMSTGTWECSRELMLFCKGLKPQCYAETCWAIHLYLALFRLRESVTFSHETCSYGQFLLYSLLFSCLALS